MCISSLAHCVFGRGERDGEKAKEGGGAVALLLEQGAVPSGLVMEADLEVASTMDLPA